MKVAFFGTPDVAAVALRALLDSRHEVVAVVTQPDRVRGRGRTPTPSPVKVLAQESNLIVLQPESPKEPEFIEQIQALGVEALAVVAYGHILSKALLSVAPAINSHFSLLPAYRGAAPVQRALMAGEETTGVTVFRLEPSVDSGPILAVRALSIQEDDDTGSLLAKLAPLGGELLVEALDQLERGEAGVAQDASAASPAPKIRPEEREVDWTQPARTILGTIRGLSPKPGSFTYFNGKRLGIKKAAVAPGVSGEPGTLQEDGIVATGEGGLKLLSVQPEGKKPMDTESFLRGYRPKVGTKLGEPG